MANWQHCPAVERASGQDGGLWMFKGTDVPLYHLYERLADGGTVDDFATRHGVDVEMAAAALEYEADELHDYRLDYAGRVPFARNIDPAHLRPDNTLWGNCPLVEQAEGRLGGAWVFKHSRLALYVLHYHLAGGRTLDEFDEWYGMDTSKAVAVLQHEAKVLERAQPAHADIV
ncbi:MAG: DUF433 domain-containing protein [Chloroflexota bacterium]|nr:DUF433 domain-containing protein [Chloroflexota bacterium]MDE2685039.1 DUF433 domain-containing protein [Chloroflexota bacterium]